MNETYELLNELRVNNIYELYKSIPKNLLLKSPPEIPSIEEKYIMPYIKDKYLARNKVYQLNKIYLGGGVWPIYIPAEIKYIISRSEFLTSYTPYQPEISQGVLQALYEYQSLMSEILEMDVVNSSMYDWASAIGEALLMAYRVKGGGIIMIPKDIARNRDMVIKTYLWGAGIRHLGYALDEEGYLPTRMLDRVLREEKVAGIYVEYPNVYGYVPMNFDEFIEVAHKYGVLVIMGVDPFSLIILKPPGEYGADIVVGEGQALGGSMNYGGPLLGIFAVRGDMALIRNMPGRIIGISRDMDGNRAYTMILQTREQHIRREKATSNICTNEALTAISVAIYISLLGKDGLLRLAKSLLEKSHKLCSMLEDIGFKQLFNQPYIREFSLIKDRPYNSSYLYKKLLDIGYVFGWFDNNVHHIAVNEYHSFEDYELLIKDIKVILNG